MRFVHRTFNARVSQPYLIQPQRPSAGSWWLQVPREGFTRRCEQEAARMAGSLPKAIARYLDEAGI